MIIASLDAVPKGRQPVERIAEVRALMRVLRESELSDVAARELVELLEAVPEKLRLIQNSADSREVREFLYTLRTRVEARSDQAVAC